LSVEALHSREVHHRDLKKDNVRVRSNEPKTIVAIDLGAAARLDSPPLRAEYDNGQVGAPAYAAPEAICGLAGVRNIGKFTDTYALGCMLFELFNRDLFFRELLTKNPNYIPALTVMGLAVRAGNTPFEKLSRWHDALRKHGQGVTPVSILTADHTVPAAIAPLLEDLVKSMTRMDYRLRSSSLEFVRQRIRSSITCLKNAEASRRKTEANRKRRAQRIARIAEREARLATAIAIGILNAK
jgi:serine/threonine protein kinase